VSAIEKMVKEAYPLDEAPEVPDIEAFFFLESPAPAASTTCPSAPSTIPSSSPALSRASSADAAQLEEYPSGFFEEDDYYRVHRLIFVAICNANNWAQLDCF
jgi:hypothetical protein